jgi:uncharacterized protein
MSLNTPVGCNTVDPLQIIHAHYEPGAQLTRILVRHSNQVREKALAVAAQSPHWKLDTGFIARAAMLHDIGIFQTRSAAIHCHGDLPYVCHGILGRQILAQYNLTACGLVCERHIGAGISIEDIERQNLPLPLRDMQPLSLVEQIICYADKFFSKTCCERERRLDEILVQLARFGADKVERFMRWHRMFTGDTGLLRSELPPGSEPYPAAGDKIGSQCDHDSTSAEPS